MVVLIRFIESQMYKPHSLFDTVFLRQVMQSLKTGFIEINRYFKAFVLMKIIKF